MRRYAIVVVIILETMLGQDAAPPKPKSDMPGPKPIAVSAEIENRILRAERDLAEITNTQLRAENQFRAAQADYNAAEARKPAATKAVNDAIAEGQKECAAKGDYTIDPADFTCKPTAAPATTPAKKSPMPGPPK
jgi:chromosome segregation ATPase